MIPLTEFLTRKNIFTGQASQHRPLLQDIPNAGGTVRFGYNEASYKAFWNQFKNCPELVAVLSTIITDILGDRPCWTKPDGKQLGRNKQLEADRFWRENRGKEMLSGMLYDLLLTGDGYLWTGRPTEKEKITAFKEVLQRRGLLNKKIDVETKAVLQKAALDEDYGKPKKMEYVASSTVSILNDEYEVLGYEQNVRGIPQKFSTQEIIHFRYMTINGEVCGFSPVASLAAEIVLLRLVKGNMLSFMRNGGSPDKVFILPKEIAGSRNHEYLVEMLRKYKAVENYHGNLVFAGEIEVNDLAGNPKDMEYKDLALYITSNIAFAWGLPATRIPYLIGTNSSRGDNGGISDAGYWNKIASKQDDIEDLLNSQLFEELGWHIRLPRKYKQDEVREAQTANMNADTVSKVQLLLAKSKKQLTVEKTLDLLDLSYDDVEEANEVIMQTVMQPSGTEGQNRLPNSQVNKEPDAQSRANTKRNVANSKGVAQAVTYP